MMHKGFSYPKEPYVWCVMTEDYIKLKLCQCCKHYEDEESEFIWCTYGNSINNQ